MKNCCWHKKEWSEMEKMEDQLKMKVPKGAGDIVDQTGVKIVNSYGIEKLKDK